MDYKQLSQPYLGTAADLQDLLHPVRTTTQLEDETDAINTQDKFVGRLVFNSTTGLLVAADAAGVNGTWSSVSDGAVDHTPT